MWIDVQLQTGFYLSKRLHALTVFYFFLVWNINMYIVRYLTYTHILNVILYITFNNFVLETKFHEANISACGIIAIV